QFRLRPRATRSYYGFGRLNLSTKYAIVHIYDMSNKTGDMKMCIYHSMSRQWNVELEAPLRAPPLCDGVLHWINKVMEDPPYQRTIVTVFTKLWDLG
ncbi:hypothetical protein PIB30_090292, partial [Stylosanthes scabra]|nr:hypothetical protein [Stylosanthes scabra]